MPLTSLVRLLASETKPYTSPYTGSRAWAPADLATPPLLQVVASSATMSGTTVTGVPNSGSLGGTFAAYDGTVTKGAQLNGQDTLSFDGASSLQLASASHGAGARVLFAVFALNQAHGALIGWQWDNSLGALVWYANDNGFSTWYNNSTGSDVCKVEFSGLDTNPHIVNLRANNDAGSYGRLDGVAQSVGVTNNGTAPAARSNVPVFLGQGGTTFGGEYLNGRVAYFAYLDYDIGLSDLQRLEGWAAWTYGLQSSLPAGHPYKAAAPTVAVAAIASRRRPLMLIAS